MFSARFYRYDAVNKSVVFSFSISIPGTDLGESAILLIDSKGVDSVLSNYN
jgi:hypothetical protein